MINEMKETESSYGDAIAWTARGDFYSNNQEYEEAIQAYQKAMEGDQTNYIIYKKSGNAYFQLKRFKEAADMFQRTTEINPKYESGFYNWGITLDKMGKYSEAIEKYKQAVSINPDHINSLNNWARALTSLNQDFEAKEKYSEIIKKEPNYPLAYHNIACIDWASGNYPESRRWWKDAEKIYRCVMNERTGRFFADGDDFQNLGNILSEIFGEHCEAENLYKEGLQLDPDHVGIYLSLVTLYQQISANCGCSKCAAGLKLTPFGVTSSATASFKSCINKFPRIFDTKTNIGNNPDINCVAAYSKARDAFYQVEKTIRKRMAKVEDAESYMQLGQVQILMEDYENAEISHNRALSLQAFQMQNDSYAADKNMAEILTKLGIVCLRMEKHSKAIQYFTQAHNRDSKCLIKRSNLADAYLAAGCLEQAETEYSNILRITPFHVESQIGLGQIYISMGEHGDSDQFDHAIRHLTNAINLGNSGNGSKLLVGREKAAVYYARGYARIKLYEVSKITRDEALLHDALSDFRRCKELDRKHHKAQRVLDKLEKRLDCLSMQRSFEKDGPWVIVALSALVFFFTQFQYFSSPMTGLKENGYYALQTFGSLVFMVAGLALPQVLKLKVAGIEMEKSSLNQIKTPLNLGEGSYSSINNE